MQRPGWMKLLCAFAAVLCITGCSPASDPADGPSGRGRHTTDQQSEPAAMQRGEPVTIDRRDPKVGAGKLPLVSLSPAFSKLMFTRPVQVTFVPEVEGTLDRMVVLEQNGRVVIFENREDVEAFDVFLDMRDRIFTGHNEEGLLSIAFHPNYAENGRFFLWYTEGDARDRRMVLSEFAVSGDDSNRADVASEQVLLKVPQPWGNHNGGTIKFGPEGYLYLSIGDGGAANDPQNNGQNLETLLGKIIRIDVDRRNDNKPYAIPEDNPFVQRQDARGEIWALGLRNVWRMSFDRETDELWAADVGQNKWEAVYIIQRGGNYGWAVTEGSKPFRKDIELAAETGQIIKPMVVYSHRHGQSITGGYVYRGQRNQRLKSAYLYADYVSSKVWAIQSKNGMVTAYREVLTPSGKRFHITSFGEDREGELYVTVFDRLDRRNSTGRVLRVVEY